MGLSDEVNATSAPEASAGTGDRPSNGVRVSESPELAPQPDALIDELETLLAELTNGETPPLHSPARSSDHAAGAEHSNTQSPIDARAVADSSSPAALLRTSPRPNDGSPDLAPHEVRCSCQDGEAANRREQLAPQHDFVTRGLGRGNSWISRRAIIPLAVLTAGVGAALVLLLMAPAHLQTDVVTSVESITDGSTNGAVRVATNQGLAVEADTEPPVHISQEPITPRLVKTIRIYERSDHLTPGAASQPRNEHQGESYASGPRVNSSATSIERLPARVQRAPGGPLPKPLSIEAEAAGSNAVDGENIATGQALEPTARFEELKLPEEAAEASTGPAPEASPKIKESAAEIGASAMTSSGSRSAEPTRFEVVSTAANMRAGPSTKTAVVKVVPTGSRVGVTSCGEWCEVVFAGERGWIHRSLFTGAAGESGRRAGRMVPVFTAGMPLISSDGVQIGTIRDMTKDPAGQAYLVVAVSRELRATAPMIRLKAEHVVAGNEQAEINVTRARFVRALPQEAIAGTAAN